MGKTLIGFTEEEIRFTTSLIEFARTKLQENHDASFSGVDQLLINSWIISTSELLSKFEEHQPIVEPKVYESVDEAVY
jgi:hypothetical protein